MSKKIYCLVKIYDDEKHAKAFIDTGEMYCNTLKAFKKRADDNERGDRFEGASQWFQPKDIKLSLTLGNENGEVLYTISNVEQDLAGPVIAQPAIFDDFNVFCMCAITIEDFEESYSTEDEEKLVKEKINNSIAAQIKIDPQCQSFGDHAVVICNVERFIKTVVSHVEKNNMEIFHGLVEYFDHENSTVSFKDIEPIFRKQKTYSHQNEFRFVVNTDNKTKGPITIDVGPLNEFAFKYPLKDLNTDLEIKI